MAFSPAQHGSAENSRAGGTLSALGLRPAKSRARLFIEPNETVQDAFKKVADYVIGNYKHHRGAEFLGDADPWLIAHAIVDRGKVVTHEIPNSLMAQQVKIPNVCKAFNIECITLFEMFRELNIVLEFKG